MVKGLGFFPIIFILLLTVSFARAEVDITNDASDDIVTFAPAGTANTDTNATQVVNDGGGGGGSTATTPTANTPISIPCVDDSGKSTATTGAGLCSAILPKCSNIRTNYEKTVKNFLTWKIWGYYQGKNVDLNASTLSATGTNLVGTDLMYPICSVVGHKMQFSGTSPLLSGNFNPCDDTRQKMAALYDSLGIEYSHQSIGKKAACGARPDTDSGTTYLTLSFRGGNGNLWNSYMVGAYPWLIRRHAYDVLTALKPDLSNLSDVVSSASVKTDLAAVGTMMNAYYADLATASTEVCSNTSIIDKCNNGTITMILRIVCVPW
jgi:hypothetical protein